MTFNGNTVDWKSLARLSLSDVISFVVMLVMVLGVYFKLDNRVNNHTEAISKNTGAIELMNKNGTNRSHETDSNQEQHLGYLDAKTSALEKRLDDMGPKVDRIDANVLWLMAKQFPDSKR
jgi:hypothetical protein